MAARRKGANARNKEIGLRVEYYRHKKKLTREGLARKARVSATQVRGIEQGEHAPLVTTLEAIARGLGVTVHHLLVQPRRGARHAAVAAVVLHPRSLVDRLLSRLPAPSDPLDGFDFDRARSEEKQRARRGARPTRAGGLRRRT